MFGISNRLLALAVVPVLALTLSACGPKPETTTTTTTTTSTGAPATTTTGNETTTTTTTTGVTVAPGGDATPAPGTDTGAPPASPGMTGGGAVSGEIVAFVEELPAKKGKDGKLAVNASEGPMLLEIVDVEETTATKTPDGKNNVPAKLKSDKGAEVIGEFLVVGETKDTATVDSLVIVQEGNRTTYIWSEETMAFVPGPAGAPGGDMGGSPAPGGDMGASPAPGGDMAAPAATETPATH